MILQLPHSNEYWGYKMNKIKQLFTVLIVLMSTIGFASAAFNMVITDPPGGTTITPGDAAGIDYKVTLSDVAALDHKINVTVDIGSTASDLEFYFTNGTTNSGWIAAGTYYMWQDSASPQDITMKVRAVNAPVDALGSEYILTVMADDLPGWTASATTATTTIPEFPTIALPIAAILGLAFIFQRRKEEE